MVTKYGTAKAVCDACGYYCQVVFPLDIREPLECGACGQMAARITYDATLEGSGFEG